MKLTRVTITGADDGVSPEALVALSKEFPFAEWGVLRGGEDRLGTPRFPQASWLAHLSELVRWEHKTTAWAIHACGEAARHIMGGSPVMFAALRSLSAQRVQLNGFSRWRLPMLCAAQLLPHIEFVLQCQSDAAVDHAAELAQKHANVSALWDISGGKGFLDFDTLTNQVAPPGLRMGRAGGIKPDNIVEIIESLDHLEEPFWLDLESGARTDDRFDLEKVRRVLELAAPFVSKEPA